MKNSLKSTYFLTKIKTNFRHDLKLDTTSHEKMSENKVFEDVQKEVVSYVAGGCSYNAMRVFNVK